MGSMQQGPRPLSHFSATIHTILGAPRLKAVWLGAIPYQHTPTCLDLFPGLLVFHCLGQYLKRKKIAFSLGDRGTGRDKFIGSLEGYLFLPSY